MSVSVRTLYKNSNALYHMQLVAGERGLNNSVKWVHIWEELNSSSFLEGNELVFLTGVNCDSEEWLLQYVKNCHAAHASAIVVNLGKYIRRIPKSVIAFCDENAFPLFTIPWETRMVDMTKDYCQRIMQSEVKEEHLSSAVKNVLFGTGSGEDLALVVRSGYPENGTYRFLAVKRTSEKEATETEEEYQRLVIEKSLRHALAQFVLFTYEEYRIVMLLNALPQDVQAAVGLLRETEPFQKRRLCMGIGLEEQGLTEQKDNLRTAIDAVRMAERLGHDVIYYQDLGIYRLLMSSDHRTLEDYYDQTIGKLKAYDAENDTKLVGILYTYLQCNGSTNTTAEKMYLHRNTVNYHLKRIQKITGLDPLNLEDKLKLYLGFYVRNLL